MEKSRAKFFSEDESLFRSSTISLKVFVSFLVFEVRFKNLPRLCKAFLAFKTNARKLLSFNFNFFRDFNVKFKSFYIKAKQKNSLTKNCFEDFSHHQMCWNFCNHHNNYDINNFTSTLKNGKLNFHSELAQIVETAICYVHKWLKPGLLELKLE